MAAERRFFESKIDIEEKEENSVKTRKISGYAAVFEKRSQDFGGWVEVIDKRAFSDVLEDDVFALFNHDPNQVLARNKVTLKLSVDEVGLRYEFSPPNTTLGNDLHELVRSGVISKSSFAFRVKEQKWEHPEDKTKPSVRTVLKVARLYDVSPVTYPAYPDSSVGTRSFKKELEEAQLCPDQKRMLELLLILPYYFVLSLLTSLRILINSSLSPAQIGKPFLKMRHKYFFGITCIEMDSN